MRILLIPACVLAFTIAAEDDVVVGARPKPAPEWCAKLSLTGVAVENCAPRALSAEQLDQWYGGRIACNGSAETAAAVQRLEALIHCFFAEKSERQRNALIDRIENAGVPWPLVASVLVNGRRLPDAAKTGYHVESVDVLETKEGHIDLHFNVPASYAAAKRSYALILAFHASGGKAEIVNLMTPPEDAILAMPQWPMQYPPLSRAGWAIVRASIEAACARYHIDPDRVAVYGGSVGGTAAYNCGLWAGDRFSAIAPGYSNPSLNAHMDGFANLHSLAVVLTPEAAGANIETPLGKLPVERQSHYRRRLKEEKVDVRQIEGLGFDELFAEMSRCTRRLPRKLNFVCYADPFAAHYWLAIERRQPSPADEVATVQLQDVTRTSKEDVVTGKGVVADELVLRKPAAVVKASIDGANNTVRLETERVAKLKLNLYAGLIDFAKPLKVTWNDVDAGKRTLTPSIRFLLTEAYASMRRDRAIVAAVVIEKPR